MLISQLPLSLEDIRASAQRLEGVAVRTPVLQVDASQEAPARQLFIKCENLQRAGAFKFRGAYNRLAQLTESERAAGVVAFSSGNHAQGVALAARLLNIAATIVMPADASRVKLQATRAFGAEIVLYDRVTEDREAIATRLSRERGATLIPPYDDYRVMAGQGTAALELVESVSDLDALLVPVGGGGLLAGCAVAAKGVCPELRIYGVEPEGGNDWALSWAGSERVSVPAPRTIADGLRTTAPGDLTWPIVRALVNGILTVSDVEIRHAMRFLLERAKVVAEPSGAVGVAAALFAKLPIAASRIGIIISGGNVDLDRLCALISDAENVP